MPIGIAAALATIGIAAKKFKHRTIKPSLYILQLRVIAQGIVVGGILLGLGYKTLTDKMNTSKDE